MANPIIHSAQNPSIRRLQQQTVHKETAHAADKASFGDVMERIAQRDINVTKHAQARLDTRGVTLSPSDVNRVAQAMDDAAKKGIKEAVIVMNEQLLIASVANRTIITAANKQALQAKIISNIDGAIFI